MTPPPHRVGHCLDGRCRCEHHGDAAPHGDIVATALTGHVFTELAGLVVDAGLVDALRPPAGNFTVFAPTDTAFGKLPLDVLHAVQDKPDMLKTVLLHHVVKDTITLRIWPARPNSRRWPATRSPSPKWATRCMSTATPSVPRSPP